MLTRAQRLAALQQRIEEVRASLKQAAQQTGHLDVSDRQRVVAMLQATLTKLEARKAELEAATESN
jgi:hypothetical protein